MVVPLSTVLRGAPTHVRVEAGEGGVPRASLAKCGQITDLRRDSSDPARSASRFARQRMLEMEKAILRAIGVPVD